MGKLMAVINEPSWCFECPFFSNITIRMSCGLNGKVFKSGISLKERPSDCPLKEIPSATCDVIGNDDYYRGYEDGWNSCIDDIIK